ncbi:hypothetical protein [Paremcibacter congregatus]|uniref:hypothetical protein n=1 Tax=Paremcibacter congregatus TaxID=2043170 RepID=UPI0030EC9808|tara:strand:+ start:6804 stop:7208 length:405 start_codon:yes stop_codon:yes gene_type:complete
MPHKTMLSGELAAIADVIGAGAALRLAHDYGGTEVNIPKFPTQGQKLVDCIGMVATEKLIRHFGTGKVEIPLGPTGNYNQFIRGQSKQINQGLADGKNCVQIARAVGCTVRTVRAHKNRSKKDRADRRNPSLFD